MGYWAVDGSAMESSLTRQWGLTVNKAKWLIISLAIVGAVAVLDLPYTVGLKSTVVGLLPIAPERKAEIITKLCNRAFPSPMGANSMCQGANIDPEWNRAYQEKLSKQWQKEAICTLFAQLTQSPVGTENNGWKVISNDAERAAIIVTNGDRKGQLFFVDYKAKSVVTDSTDLGLGGIDCPDLKAPPL